MLQLLSSIPLSSRHKSILNKIKNNPYQGELKKLYSENCITELLFNILETLNVNKKNSVYKLTQKDEDMLLKANQILLENFQYPPTISELSKLVATNTDKLKKGFKVLFNNTIFNTVTDYRLQNAYENLKNGDMNVDEVAFESGYKSTSSFITVFKKRYGLTPGQMREKRSRKYYY